MNTNNKNQSIYYIRFNYYARRYYTGAAVLDIQKFKTKKLYYKLMLAFNNHTQNVTTVNTSEGVYKEDETNF